MNEVDNKISFRFAPRQYETENKVKQIEPKMDLSMRGRILKKFTVKVFFIKKAGKKTKPNFQV